MVSKRLLAISSPEELIKNLPEETQNIVRSDLREYARENSTPLKWDITIRDYEDMGGRFCDIEKIYENTEVIFCKPGDDIEPYQKSLERHITLKLYNDDMAALCEKAAEAGFTVSELLENFIADLIHGAYTNGSDERMYANKWFYRCWFGMDSSTSFLTYVLEQERMEEVLNLWSDRKHFNSMDKTDEYDQEEVQMIEDELDEIFSQYKGSVREPSDDSIEKGMEKVLEWHKEKRILMNEEI